MGRSGDWPLWQCPPLSSKQLLRQFVRVRAHAGFPSAVDRTEASVWQCLVWRGSPPAIWFSFALTGRALALGCRLDIEQPLDIRLRQAALRATLLCLHDDVATSTHVSST